MYYGKKQSGYSQREAKRWLMITKTEVKVRGYHLDVYQHVNNTRYLEFLEAGRWDFNEETHLFDGLPEGIGCVAVNININFRRPAVLGDILEVRTGIGAVNSKSIVTHQEIVLRDTNAKVADADVTQVLIDFKTQKAVPLKGNLPSFDE